MSGVGESGPGWFAGAAAALVGLRFFAGRVLDLVQAGHVARNRGIVPEALADRVGTVTQARSAGYELDRLRFGNFAAVWRTAITLALLFSGIVPWFSAWLAGAGLGGVGHGLALWCGLLAGIRVLEMPLDAWDLFVIEQRHGFNTMTPAAFACDEIKGAAVAGLLGVPLLAGVLFLIGAAGEGWWLWAAGLVVAFQAGAMIVHPLWLAPWFNRFDPLAAGPARDAIGEILDRLRFPARNVFVMDGSRRSRHSNAYLAGAGAGRRVVVYDTLLALLNPAELAAVVAHEVGHHRLRHVPVLLGAGAAVTALVLGGAAWLLDSPAFHEAFGLRAGDAAAGLFLALRLGDSALFWLSPLLNGLSRRFEFQADAFAARAMGNPAALESALVTLAGENLGTVTPHPLFALWHAGHPSMPERIGALRKCAGGAA